MTSRWRSRAAVLVTAAPLLAGGVSLASADDVTPTNQQVGSGGTAVTRCGDPATWTYGFTNNAAGELSAVRVSGVPSACVGGTLHVTLARSGASRAVTAGAVLLATDCASGSCSRTLSVAAPLPGLDTVNEVHASVTGSS